MTKPWPVKPNCRLDLGNLKDDEGERYNINNYLLKIESKTKFPRGLNCDGRRGGR